MKIIHLISGGDVGGAKTHVLSLLQGLCRDNQVLLTCFMEGDFSRDAEKLGIPVKIMSSRNLPRVCHDLVKLIRQEQFQVVHCHGSRANLMGALIRDRISVPIVTTIHSDPKLDYMGRPMANLVYGRSNAWALKRLRYREGVSGPTCEMLTERGFSPLHTFEICNGVDFSDLTAPVDRQTFLDSLGLSREENSVVFGIAARISPVKDMKTLVRGFAKAAEQEPGIRLIIAGDGEERPELEKLVGDLGLRDKIAFAGWLTDTASFYNAIDVNVLTSLSEGFPYAIPEGARMRCATIATNIGGIPQVVHQEETGLLFRPGDTDTLAEWMLRLARDGDLRRRLGDAIFEYVREHYSLEATCRRQIEIYEKIFRLEERRDLPRDGVVICGSYGNGNAGDDTILRSIVHQLREKDPLLPICVMSRTPSETAKQTGADSVYSFSLLRAMGRMRRAAMFISGGGSLIQDVTSTRSLLYYLFTIRLAHRLGCRVMMYGCGIGPVRRRMNRALSGRVLNGSVDYATLRDPDSLQELRDLGAARVRARVTADPALLSETEDEKIREYLKNAGIRPEGKYCLFALRPWKLERRQLAAFAAAADYAYDSYGMTPVFFMMEPAKDREITERVATKVGVPYVILPPLEDDSAICALMCRMKLVVSMRLHALIFAASQGIPVVGIAYDPKVSSFLDYMGQECCLLPGEITDGNLLDQMDAAISGEAATEAIVVRMRALAAQNGEIAWSLLTGNHGEI